jgi:PAS domain S-box-containing protein
VTPAPELTRHSFTLRSHLSETSHARELVLPFAVEAGFSEERCFDIQVASSEACANAIEHSPADSEVEFTVLLYSDRLEIQVEGRGEFELPAAAARERVHRGLGLPLMAKLSDHLSLYSGPRGGTLVALTFYRPGFRDRQETDDVTPPWIREVVEENELVAAITGAAPVGLYVLDPELRFRWANPAYREFLEEPYRSQSLDGIYIGEAVPGSEEMGSLEILRAVSRTGETAFFPEYEYVGFTRGTTYWRWEILPLKRERPDPPWDVLVVISEMTEQVEQRRRLESASRSYHALAENSGLGLALCRTVCDAEGKAVDFEFVEVNGLHRAFTGLPPEEVLGRKVSEVIHGFSQELIDAQNQVALSGEPREEEIYEPHLGRWYRLNLYSPEPGYFVSLFIDITKRKQAEEELRAFFDSPGAMRGIVEIVDDNTVLHVRDNRVTTDFAGLPDGAFDNRLSRDLGEPHEIIALWVEHYREAERTGEPVTFEYPDPRGSGETWLSATVSFLRIAASGQPQFVYVVRDVTERKRAEEALRESEERTRQIAQAGGIGFVEWNAATDTGYWSREHQEIFGCEPGSPMSLEQWLQGLHPEDRERVMANFSRLMARARSEGHVEGHRDEYRFIRPDGNTAWVESDMSVDMVGDQPIIRGSVRDITERKKAEEALEASERQLRTVLENSLDGINMLDLATGRYLFMNDAQAQLTGFTANELEGMTAEQAYDRVHPDDRAVSVAQQKRVAAGEDTAEPVEYRWKVKSGEYRWFSDRRKLARDQEGRPIALVGISRDITERKQAEEALRESDEQFRMLTENLATAVALVNERGEFTLVNEAFLRLFGLAEDADMPNVNSQDWSQWQVFDEVGRLLDVDEHPVRKAVLTRSPVRDVLVAVQYPGGTDRRWVLVSAEPIFDAQTELHRLICTYHDITERKRTEEAQRESEERYRGLAAENERLYRQQLDIAENLQFAFLNIPSEIGPVSLGHLYRSATEAARIGGDFYDVFEVKEGQIAVLIGDVSGHGIQAARTATLVKDVIHAFTHQSLRTHEVLRHTNKLLLEKNLPGFVTAFLGILDQNTGRLRYSLAGHPEALLRRVSGEVQRLGSGTSPLGVYPDPSWRTHEVDLEANDVLVLYTDGVIEARRNGEFFGETRLENVIKRTDVSPQRLPQLVLDQILAFSDGGLQDDVAVLALSLREIVVGTSKPPVKQEKLLG